MPEILHTQSVSRSGFMDLQEELRLVNDGYEFLDQKRILLAAEMLRQRETYLVARERFAGICAKAANTLLDAAADQGLDDLQVHPAAEHAESILQTNERLYVG